MTIQLTKKQIWEFIQVPNMTLEEIQKELTRLYSIFDPHLDCPKTTEIHSKINRLELESVIRNHKLRSKTSEQLECELIEAKNELVKSALHFEIHKRMVFAL